MTGGGTWDWYLWDLAGFPSATLQPCTVRGVGPNIYIVVRDADWDVTMNQPHVDAVLEHAETRSYGIDGDPRMSLLYHDFTISSDGFVGWADPYPNEAAELNKSNECEALYLNGGPDAGVDHDPSST